MAGPIHGFKPQLSTSINGYTSQVQPLKLYNIFTLDIYGSSCLSAPLYLDHSSFIE